MAPAPLRYVPGLMATHPGTKAEILAALESNARTIESFFATIPERAFFDGSSDQWSPAHHLVHLTRGSVAMERALRSGTLPLHPTGRSRSYVEVRDAAAADLDSASRDTLLTMGRMVVVEPGVRAADVLGAFLEASARLRNAAGPWTEEAMDGHAVTHPLMGALTVREMLLFFVVHERHHLRGVQRRLAAPAFELQPTLRGAHITLRPLAEGDFDALFAAGSDPLIWEQHPEPDRHTREKFRRYFDGGMASRGAFAIVDRATGRIIGSSRYCDLRPDQVEIGWTFLERACWGGEVNRELKALMLDHAFRFVPRVVFVVGENNQRSRKALEKIGARLLRREPRHRDGTPEVQAIFGIEGKEWAERARG